MADKQLNPIIESSFLQYAGAVLQSRALVDVRDSFKPSAREIFYCLYTDKFTHNKPFQKTLKAIGSAFRMYIHGDSSAEGIIMRAGQPFAMRYPLVEVEGSYGTLLSSGSWAAPRYTGARLSQLADYVFKDIEKDTIDDWRDNYDDTEKYPSVLPSKGFFNLVNGGMGIAVGASMSCPQYNLKEMNEALIKLLWNPEIEVNEINLTPDFATGAILLNEEQVLEAQKTGRGSSCLLRSVVNFDKKDRCLVVTEIPYMLYTDTICKELEEIVNGDQNPGIERFNDLTGKTPLIKIYLSKNANPDKIIKYLYKNTSLQTHYSINFTMLDDGRFPKEFGWKEILQSHLDHERIVYIRGFQYDLRKILSRLHIIEGLLKAIDAMDEVIATIKSSASTAAANLALQKLLAIDEGQAKAILDIKLARLAKMEINKLVDEQTKLNIEKERIEDILADEVLLKKEIEKGLREVMDKFGDERRTKVMNLEVTEDEEVIEEKKLNMYFTNESNVFLEETSTLFSQRRGSTGTKFKLNKTECVIGSSTTSTTSIVYGFSSDGKYYSIKISELPIGEKVNFPRGNNIISVSGAQDKKYILFATKHGYIKKALMADYTPTNLAGAKAITLEDDDEVVSVAFINDEKVGLLARSGNFIHVATVPINSIGRLARGRIGMKLEDGDEVICMKEIPDETNELVFVTRDGYIKRVGIEEFSVVSVNSKGVKSGKKDNMPICFEPTMKSTNDVNVICSKSKICLSLNDIPSLGRATLGVKAIKLKPDENVISLQR